MQPFVRHTGTVAALPRTNVDTDQIIPKQFLKRIERTGFGSALFYDWRYLPGGAPNPEFELNQPEAAGATVLVAGSNFGCGSSREHAPWALGDYGFRALIAPSFADIFYGNCCQNGLLPVVLPARDVDELFRRYAAATGYRLSGYRLSGYRLSGYRLSIDLEAQRVTDDAGFAARFEIAPYRREMLLQGLDEVGRTLLDEDRIAAFERRRAS